MKPLDDQVIEAFWEELAQLCHWAFASAFAIEIEEIQFGDAWVFVLDSDDTLTCWRATLSLDKRWTLSPVY
jgi:hypothetical protein